MSRRVLTFMLAVSLAAFCGTGIGTSYAEDIVTVEEEVVTGSRIYTSLEEVPAATYVIDREEIEKSGASKISEVLDKIPGVFTRTRAGNTQDEFIEMRGLTTELLVLVDGVPYYKTSHLADAAAVDLRSIPLEQVERIEVVKGAGSAIYGSMAAAGVINIITRRPDKPELAVTGEAGTHDWWRGAFWASAPGEKIDVSAWFSHSEEGESPLLFYTDGTSTFENRNLDYSNDSGGFTLSGGPLDFSATWGTYSSKWTYGADLQEQENDFARYTLTWNEGPNRLIFYLDDQDKDVIQYGTTTTVEDQAWGAEYTRRSTWGDRLVSWGLAFREEDMTYDLPAYFIHYDKSRTNYAPFVEVSAPVGEMLLNVGLRYENWDQKDAEDYDEVIPKLSLSYQAMNDNLWYLSAGRFFAMPSLYQLAYFGFPATEPNLDLKPEDGYSYELGCKGQDEKGNWNVGLFYLEMDDKIDIAPDWSVYVNVDEFRSWGIEASRGWVLSPLWNFTLGMTWMNAEEKNAGGDWIKGGTPEWDIDATLAYAKGPFRSEMTLRYLGDREDQRAGIGELSQDDVTTVDAMIQYDTQAGTFRLSGFNLFDEEYYLQDYTSFGTTTRYYGAEQRFYLTWEYKF